MKLEFTELEIEWPSELTVFGLKNYILSELMEYGKPLRWAITSVSTHSENKNQLVSIEVVFIINEEESKFINTILN